MDARARRSLALIRRCIAAGRFRLLPHFIRRMHGRGLVWPDLLAAIDAPDGLRADGHDDWGRPRWVLSGRAGDGVPVGIVCVIGSDAAGELTVFITLLWED